MNGGDNMEMKEKIASFLVVSDNHSDRQILVKVADKFEQQVDLLLCCGDSLLNKNDELTKRYQLVEGNCDFPGSFASKKLISTAAGNIFLTHGHYYYVNFGIGKLMIAAQEKQAKFCFFGHTHQLGVEFKDNCLFLNPGSIAFPRGKYQDLGGTFAIVTVYRDQQILVKFYDRDCLPIKKLAREFQFNE
jgi:putative phosphoesterase